MNDPHVVALIYRIDHGDSIDYSQAPRLDVEEPRFRLTVEDRRARFEFKVHYATEERARQEIAEYIRVWEFDATLKRGNPDSFRLQFEKAEVIDRNPTPGAVRISGRLEVRGTGSARITLRVPAYPAPPSDIALDPDAETMHQRYLRHRQGREPLPAMAYFCLTVLELAAGGRKAAAHKYRIDLAVLSKIGELTSGNRSGPDARKASRAPALTDREHHFLRQAVKAVIRRVAERAHAPAGGLPRISRSDLPSLESGPDSGTKAGK